MNQSVEELDVLIRAAHPVIFVVSHEEHRVAQALSEIVERKNKNSEANASLWTWSLTDGAYCGDEQFADLDGPVEILEHIGQYDKSGVFMLKDFAYFLNEGPAYMVQRKLKDLTSSMGHGISIVIVDSELNIPPRVEKLMTVVDFDLPSAEELKSYTDWVVRDHLEGSVENSSVIHEEACEAAVGLTATEVENVFCKSLAKNSTLDPLVIMEEKKHIIRKSGVLQYHDVDRKMKDVGGLRTLKSWVNQRGRAFSSKAREYGLPHPKGALIVGIPGTGKSLIAKCIGASWKMPVLRMDVGALFGQFVGQSEANMRKALKTAEALAPCVLWIDELEKGFGSASGGGSHDSGTSARVFGSFLSWMQEKQSPVFVVATANDVSQLPPEMLRKGRFDELFFVDLPNAVDREEVFKIHINRLNRDPDKFDIDSLVKLTDGFTGAEIEQVIVDGLFKAFDSDREPEVEDFAFSAERTVPISKTMEDKIAKLRSWADGRALMANDPGKRSTTVKAVKREGRAVSKSSDWSNLKAKKAN